MCLIISLLTQQEQLARTSSSCIFSFGPGTKPCQTRAAQPKRLDCSPSGQEDAHTRWQQYADNHIQSNSIIQVSSHLILNVFSRVKSLIFFYKLHLFTAGCQWVGITPWSLWLSLLVVNFFVHNFSSIQLSTKCPLSQYSLNRQLL